jgi:hypothetical protein
MKHRISKLLALPLVLVLLFGATAAGEASAAAGDQIISIRIEGIEENLYYNSAVAVNLTNESTVSDVLNILAINPDVPKITAINERENSRITQIGALKEKTIGDPLDDGWMIRVNGKNTGRAPDMIKIGPGDELVIYYADASLLQYPEVDLTRMISDGIVTITSSTETVDDKGNIYITRTPIAEAAVTWDGMAYTTDSNGAFIIDSTGAGIRHSIQVERYHENGLPTVLRLAPEYTVKYGFEDVEEDDWYFGSVMFVAEKYLINGVSDSGFAPGVPMSRAMFVTVIGRLTGADSDQSEETGFPDVLNDGWSAGYIAWASKNGIVTGYPDGTFGQYEEINREQIAVLLYKYALFKGYNTALAYSDISAYTDFGSVSGYAETAVRWAVEQGLLIGSGGRLDPQGIASRAQAATLLERFVSKFCS